MDTGGEPATGSHADRRATLQAAAAARLKRVAEQEAPTGVLEPEAAQEVRELTELVSDDGADLQSRFLLGWMHWYRYRALPEGHGQQDLDSAISMFAPCFLSGVELQMLPEPLLPVLAEEVSRAAVTLHNQALSSTDPELISAAADMWARLVTATPDDDAARAGRLSNLGLALRARFELTGALGDLEEAVRVGREAVAATPVGHADRAAMLSNLANALRLRFEQSHVEADLDEAIRVGQDAAAAIPGHPNRAAVLSILGNALQTRFERTGSLDDLDEAIRVGHEARELTELVGDDEADLQSRFLLGWMHWYRYQALPEGHRQQDLDSAISMFAPCFLSGVELQMLPEPLLPVLAEEVSRAAVTLHNQALSSTDPELISAAADMWARLVTATPDDDAARAGRLSNLGLALRARFELTGALGDLEEAVRVGREAVAATPVGHADRAAMLSNLGNALQARFERTGAEADLDEAIRVGQEAVAATPAGHPNRAPLLSNFGNALQTRFERTGSLDDLEEAIRVDREAVAATPVGHPDRAGMQSNLGNALHRRFKRTGAQADLDEAIRVGQEAVAATPAGHPDRAAMQSNLGAALQTSFERTGALPDLDEAIANQHEATAATPVGHPSRAGSLSTLGNTLRTRFERTGAEADLDQAIRVGQEAVAATPIRDHDRAVRLSDLGVALQRRSERTGALADLEEVIANQREAIAATPVGHPDRATMLSNLGAALQARFERTGAEADLDEAIRVGQEAVAATPVGHPDRPGRLSNLGVALQTRFERTGVQADLDEAVANQHEAIAASPVGYPDRSSWLSNFGITLRIRFERTGEQADLDEAIRVSQEAVAATSVRDYSRTSGLFNLGVALRIRFERTGAKADLDEAIDAFGRAMDAGVGSPSERVRAARAGSKLAAASRPKWAADLMERAVLLLPEVVPRQLDRGDQQYALGGLSGLASDAAALVLAVPTSSPEERAALALRLLEAGRAILFSQALEVRSDLTDLTDQHPELASRFTRLRDLLDRAPGSGAPTALPAINDPAADAASEADRLERDRQQLASDLAEVLAEIRDKEGFGSFARLPSTTELLQQAAAGPVVVFNVSQYRSDALVLTQGGITSLPLPGLAIDTVIAQINTFHEALHSTAHGQTSPERAAAQRQLNQILGWLWDVATGPVLDALGYRTQPAPDVLWPRLWWAPGGLLGLLPIHAAGHHGDPANDPGRRVVIDRVISLLHPHHYRPSPRPPTRPSAHRPEHDPVGTDCCNAHHSGPPGPRATPLRARGSPYARRPAPGRHHPHRTRPPRQRRSFRSSLRPGHCPHPGQRPCPPRRLPRRSLRLPRL